MADEKRIVEFEPATQLEIDDWFAVDSPSQGTRKIQKSMFMADEIASLQALSTAMGGAQTDIGNLQTRAGMSQNLNFGDNLTDGVNILSVLLGAEPYVNTRTYAVGEYCIYEKQLYKCTTAVSSAEDFDSDKWTLTNVKTELTELNSSLTPKEFTVTAGENITIAMQKCYKIGKLAVLKITAKATQNITGSKIIINFPSGMRALQNGSVFISGQGSQWGISNFEYTYLTTNGIITDNLTANTFIHIDTTIVIE